MDEPGPLYIRHVENGGGSSIRRGGSGEQHSTESLTKVSATTLDAAVPTACALKVDSEGSDFRVLRSAKRLLQESIVAVDFEFVPEILREMGDDPEQLLHFLHGLGFHIWNKLTPEEMVNQRRDSKDQHGCGWRELEVHSFAMASSDQPLGYQLIGLRGDIVSPAGCASSG
ncbi:unnamed protein product [Polarella glacialis]|uniref:Methyltransferase FkbM domain-containing protein n=1 Tax=Polarella glacialis TaxID=89957 RepID=A0A813HBS3_POLGL|nr:unnamed protein product [Polarella glacialis]CAE8741158.1 unnamed protein product [Polarella glacialis]